MLNPVLHLAPLPACESVNPITPCPREPRTCDKVSNQEALMTPRHFALQLTLLAAAVVPVLGVQPKVEQGFTSLFNGKDLTGWIYGQRANGQENKSGKGYQVEN